jgi:hypothetical protein
MSPATESQTPPWHSVFPTPSTTAERIPAEQLREWVQNLKSGEDYIVVDARRTDFEASAPAAQV